MQGQRCDVKASVVVFLCVCGGVGVECRRKEERGSSRHIEKS